MSRETGRETDRSSSGAQGRGGAAYPSGTPPYGFRPGQEGAEDAAGALPEEPKTETTLTTRIRINIPGSRPIPPVVVRKPVGEGGAPVDDRAAAAARAAEVERIASGARPEPEPARPEPAPEPEPAAQAAVEEKPASDWFAPRKSSPAAPAPAAPAPKPAPAPAAPAGPRALGAGPSASTGAPGFTGSASDGVPSGAGTTQSMPIVTLPTGGPNQTPAHGSPVIDPMAGAPANPLYDDGPGHTPAAGTPVLGGPAAPAGPTTGPVTGGSSMVAAPGRPRGGQPQGGRPGGRPQGPQGGRPGAGQPGAGQLGAGQPGGGLPGVGQLDAGQTYADGAPRLSDDTAVLTPQPPAPVPGPVTGPLTGGGGNVSGATLNSGVPFGRPDGPDLTPRIPERDETPAPAPAAPRPTPASTAKPVKKRSKLVLACVGVIGLAGVAYGAGLLLNHSDVPKGTTVLGVDVGGGTKDEAVAKLDAALGKRASAPLQLSVDGKKVELAPDKAGLALDTQETVRAASGSDYNPVSVIGSLFGGERVAQPVFPIDEEKLAVALTDLSGSSGSVTEGTILFSPGKVTPVEGKAGKGIDVQRAMISVKDAYRAQVQTGLTKTVELPVVTRRPTVTKAELDRAMEEFARPAMSGIITIEAGGKKIDFGPNRSLPKILSMKAVDGRLVEVYDKKAIDELLDGVFDGVMITKGDGTKHQVSADDVAFVMRDALRGKTKAERTKSIDLSGNG
ncbi:hypothetical protein [Streptomyces sp. NPDC003943]